MVRGDRSGHGADDAGEQPCLSGAAVWGEQPAGDYSGEPEQDFVLVPDRGEGPEGLQEAARVAELRWDQLFGCGVGEWGAGGDDSRGVYPRAVRYFGEREGGEGCRGGCAGDAAAASGRSA